MAEQGNSLAVADILVRMGVPRMVGYQGSLGHSDTAVLVLVVLVAGILR